VAFIDHHTLEGHIFENLGDVAVSSNQSLGDQSNPARAVLHSLGSGRRVFDGAHLLLQTRTKVLNNELEEVFSPWYPLFRVQAKAA
jgi:hypothetical protein